MTAEQKLQWIRDNVTYMEHKVAGVLPAKVKLGAYWPQEEHESHSVPDLVGLDLDDYIEAQQ